MGREVIYLFKTSEERGRKGMHTQMMPIVQHILLTKMAGGGGGEEA